MSAVAVTFCLFFIYIRYSSRMAELRYDIKTVEADDYTIQMKVSPQQVKNLRLSKEI